MRGDVFPEGVGGLEALSQTLGELIVQLGQVLLLYLADVHLEDAVLTRQLARCVLVGESDGELLVLPFDHALQLLGETGHGEGDALVNLNLQVFLI